MILKRKAAMFGLDARIALAIFASISAISGAVLFQAINRAKATAILSEMDEIGKAWGAYYLDVEEPLILRITGTDPTYEIKWLVENPGLKGWKGPYTSLQSDGSILKMPTKYYYTLLKVYDDAPWPGNAQNMCEAGDSCSIWVNYNGIDNERWALAIDDMVDGSDGPIVGNFRWWTDGDPNYKWRYNLKIMATKNPLD